MGSDRTIGGAIYVHKTKDGGACAAAGEHRSRRSRRRPKQGQGPRGFGEACACRRGQCSLVRRVPRRGTAASRVPSPGTNPSPTWCCGSALAAAWSLVASPACEDGVVTTCRRAAGKVPCADGAKPETLAVAMYGGRAVQR